MPRRLADRYVLGERLGAGGSSRVHIAIDTRLGRKVAVKLLNADVVATADPAGRERFLREGRTTAAFSHRNAVTVFDAGEDSGDLFIVMELVDGPSLAERLAQSGPLSIGEAVRIASEVLSVLATAHAAGIVHRDIKPANILIGANGETKLADFGIAKRFDDLEASVTATGTVVGTPRYLAPEQAVGGAATPASDVYSVGVVLFEMLTGRLPFEAETTVASALAQQTGPAPDVRTLRPEVPTGLAVLISQALATQLADRFASAAEMLTSLRAAELGGAGLPPRSTRLMPVAALAEGSPAPTSVLPRESLTAGPQHRKRSTGPTAVLLFVVLVLLGLGVVAAIRSDDDPAGLVANDTVVIVPATPATTAPATAPPETEPPPTPPPTTQSPVDEIIPGFPATDDIEVFLAQVEQDPESLGQSGPELADLLRTVVLARGREQRQQAADLRDVLDEFVEDGEIPAQIAEALDPLLADLAGRNGDDGEEGD
jgi:eukaryotic-like serine/threonine-protein kinase